MRSLLAPALSRLRNRPPVPYVSSRLSAALGLGGGDTEGQMRQYGANPTLFATVSRTAQATSQVQWKLWRKAASGRVEDRQEVRAHIALDLWENPNPWYSQEEFIETVQQHLDLTGEMWWLVGRAERLSNMPLELWPIRPDRMEVVPSTSEFIAGYVYHGPGGEKVPLTTEQAIQVKLPNPLDPYRGLGPVQALFVDLDSARYGAEWNRNFFINGAEPGGIIEVPDTLQDWEFDQMQARWDETHKGVANAHRVAILEKGQWKERKYTMRDLQFVELRRASRDQVLEALGFPKPLLGVVEDVNRANAEAADAMFAKWLVSPRCSRLRGALNNRLLPLFGGDTNTIYEFDFDDPVPPSPELEMAILTARVGAAEKLITLGFDEAEVLEALELPELTMAAPPPAPVPPPPGAAPAPGEVEERVAVAVTWALARMGYLDGNDGHEHPQAGAGTLGTPRALPAGQGPRPFLQDDHEPAQLDAVQADWEQALTSLLAQWRPITDDQRAQLAEHVEVTVDDDDRVGLLDYGLDTFEAEGVLGDAMVAMAEAAAQRMVDEAAAQGVNVDPAVPGAPGLRAYAQVIVRLLAEGLGLAAVREALRVWYPDATGTEVGTRVDDHLASLSDAPLRDLLGGALTKAQNDARMATLRTVEEDPGDRPVPAYYGNETLDTNTCGPCREVDGRWLGNTLLDVARSYPNGGYIDCKGRERCRGTVEAVFRPATIGEALAEGTEA